VDRLARQAAAVVAETDPEAAADAIEFIDNAEVGLALEILRNVTLDQRPGIHPAADLVQEAVSLMRKLGTQSRQRRR